MEAILETIINKAQLLKSWKPLFGIICGSGLGGFVELIENSQAISYEDLSLPSCRVHGHCGNLVYGSICGVMCVCVQGRFHPYEGHSPKLCTALTRLMAHIGAQYLLVTNASGALNENYRCGDIMILKDHINLPALTGQSPLVGSNEDDVGPRFLPMSNAYDLELRKAAMHAVMELGLEHKVHEGVYCMQFGPSYETIAEARMLRMMGGDVVGMSTAHEVTAARYAGMRVLGISFISNKVVMDYDSTVIADHQEVVDMGSRGVEDVGRIVQHVIRNIAMLR